MTDPISTIPATDDPLHRRRLDDITRLAEQVGALSEVIRIALEHLQNDDPRRARLTLESALNRKFE
jgi:hypothetical protein